MHFKRSALSNGVHQRIKVVPLTGILFLLLLFMSILLGLSVSPQGVKVSLPRLLTGEGLVYEHVELVVNSADGVYLNGSPVSEQGLKDFFAQVSKKRPVLLIKSEQKATLGKVMEICSLARSMGISEIRLISH